MKILLLSRALATDLESIASLDDLVALHSNFVKQVQERYDDFSLLFERRSFLDEKHGPLYKLLIDLFGHVIQFSNLVCSFFHLV